MEIDHSSAENIIALYHEGAEAWDSVRKGNCIERAWLERFRAQLPVKAEILDLGCGGGDPIAAYFLRHGCRVCGVDSSVPLLAKCRQRFPDAEWHLADMRGIALGKTFSGILAWDSFFHLTRRDQRQMFAVFRQHSKPGTALMFTSGPHNGEAIGEFMGQPLYHASLAHDEYRQLQPSAIRELLKHSKMPGVISLAGGIPSGELFDKEGLTQATQSVLEESFGDAFQYGLTEGNVALREQLVGLCKARGIETSVERLLITSGSQQALDLLIRSLANPGDVFVVERPTYLATLQILSLTEATVQSVGSDADGMIVDELEVLLATTRIKAVYIVPTFGNPSGTTLSAERRQKLVKLAAKHDFVIIEDDPYGAISFTEDRQKTLFQTAAEMGDHDSVVYTSTFSKILAPGLRVGWIVLPEWMQQKVAIVKQATDLHANSFTQSLVAAYLKTNRLDPQIALIRDAYKQKCLALSKFLKAELSEHITFNQPQGGMFLWAQFRYDFDTTQWLQQTLEKGVVYVPGEFFFSDHADKKTLRFSYATATEEQLFEAVKRLKSAL